MKYKMLKSLSSAIALSACLMGSSQAMYAQVNADLELLVSAPANNQIIPFGDTLHTVLFIVNHGPDPIVDDTLLIRNNLFPVNSGFVGNIAVGDTGVCHGIVQWADSGYINNDTISLCYYLPDAVSISNDVTDNNASNDTACVSYVMLGNPNNMGIADLSASTALKVYPNPAKDVLKVKLPERENQEFSFRIYDILGRTKSVFSKLKSNLGMYTLPLNGFSNGIYMLEVNSGKTSYHWKFVVSKF